MTLFTRVFKDLNITRRVWDQYFLDGIFVLFQAAISVLRLLEEKTEGIWGEIDSILPTLQQAGREIQLKIPDPTEVEELILKYMYEVQFPKYLYDEIPLLEQEFFQNDLKFD